MTFRGDKKISLIGAGVVGTAILKMLSDKGYIPASIISRSADSAKRAAALTGCPGWSVKIEELDPLSDIVIISTPDDAISEVVESLSERGRVKPGAVVFHTSGVHSSEILLPLKKFRVVLLSIHPVQTFINLDQAIKAIPGTYFGIEGDSPEIARKIVGELGGIPVVIDAEKKALYHAACVFSSNYLVTLIHLSNIIMERAKTGGDENSGILNPLIKTTVENVMNYGVKSALTGPVLRVDKGTLREHIKALKRYLPALSNLYVELASRTADLSAGIRPSLKKEYERVVNYIKGELEN